MDEPGSIQPESDTTLAILEAYCASDDAWVCRPQQLELENGQPVALCGRVSSAKRGQRPALQVGPPARRALSEFGAVFMRKDPPFDLDYYFATLLLERARATTFLVNDPRGLREANEKLYIFNFPELAPPTRVTRDIGRLRQFLDEQQGEMIVKPLDACGGAGVFHVRADDRNTRAILEAMTGGGSAWVMAQKYLPEARKGDKRILLLDGEPAGAVLRVPRPDETRANLHAGGRAERTQLDDWDLEICRRVGERCRADGLYFVGLDVIGGWLTEVNVTSPTGVQEIERLEGPGLARRIADWLRQKSTS
jgi:glutathione synthase